MAFEIALQIAFRLALGAGIVERMAPAQSHPVILHEAVLNRNMIPLIDEVQTDTLALILCNGKTKAIGATLRRQMRAVLRVSEIAEILQLGMRRRDLVASGATRSAEACSQRQPARKVPGNRIRLLRGIEKRTSHGLILFPMTVDCVKFFHL